MTDTKPTYKPMFYRIFRRVSATMIITVEDALHLGKIRFTLTKYAKGQGASATVEHYVDTNRAALLAWDLLNTPNTSNTARGDVSLWWNGYAEFKGSRKDGELQARTFRVELATKSENPVRITIANGPGEPVGTNGAIKPKAGSQSTEVTTLLPWLAVREMALALLMHLQAWQTMTYYQRRDEETWQPDQAEQGATATVDLETGEITGPNPRRAIPPQDRRS